jgi:hypothetical protein
MLISVLLKSTHQFGVPHPRRGMFSEKGFNVSLQRRIHELDTLPEEDRLKRKILFTASSYDFKAGLPSVETFETIHRLVGKIKDITVIRSSEDGKSAITYSLCHLIASQEREGRHPYDHKRFVYWDYIFIFGPDLGMESVFNFQMGDYFFLPPGREFAGLSEAAKTFFWFLFHHKSGLAIITIDQVLSSMGGLWKGKMTREYRKDRRRAFEKILTEYFEVGYIDGAFRFEKRGDRPGLPTGPYHIILNRELPRLHPHRPKKRLPGEPFLLK